MSSRGWAFVVAATLLLSVSAASAQTNETAFSVERFVTAPGAAQFWVTQDATVLAHLAFSGAMTTSVMSKPIVLRELGSEQPVTTPVRTRFGVELLAAVGVLDKLQFGIAVPFVVAQTGDRLRGTDLDETALKTTALGDVRLHGKVRLRGRAGMDGLAVALALNASFPTGDDNHFAGEKSMVVQALFIASLRTPRWGAAINLGRRLRVDEVVLLSPARPHGNETVGSVAAEAVLHRGLSAIAEYAFVRGVAGDSAAVRGPSPTEFRGGLRLFVSSRLSVGAGMGWGTSPAQVGSPAWRLFATVSWASEMERLVSRGR